jgi:hypothetical protein
VELYVQSPSTPSWRGAQLKHRENFTFTFYLKKNSVAVNEDKITLSYSMMGEMGYP